MSIEVIKQALEALERVALQPHGPSVANAITAIRAAIEQAEKPQRVCSGCDKTNTNDSMWAVYCVDCWEKTEALEEVKMQLKQEPVAWMVYTLDGKSVCVTDNPADFTDKHRALPLYTAPRQWVGVTAEEVHEAFCHVEYETPNDWNTDPDDWCQQFARYIDARLKEKNT